MAKLTQEQLLDAFASMSVLELADFKKAFEDKFGVTAAAPVSYTHLTLPTILLV